MPASLSFQHSPNNMEPPPPHDFSSIVDTSRPFTSVREAVAIFGDLGEIFSPKPFSAGAVNYSPTVERESSSSSWRLSSTVPSPSPIAKDDANENKGVLDTLKKLEAELEKTKAELKLLKERGSETEVALATLNAELHKNMSKLAQAEAAAAGKAAVATTKTVRFEIEKGGGDEYDNNNNNENIRRGMKESKTLDEVMMSSPLGENDPILNGKKKQQRQKPIIPLVGDFLFFKKKKPAASSTNHHHHHNNPSSLRRFS